MRTLKTWAFLVALIGSLILAASCAKKDSNVLRVGMECAYAPFNWTQTTDQNGAVKIDNATGYAYGYDVMMAKKIADGLGRKLAIVKIEWDGLIPAVQNDKIDAIIAGMCMTQKRAQAVDFSGAYYSANLIMITTGEGKYGKAKTLKDFAGAKVTSQLNTVGYGVLDQIAGATVLPGMDTTPSMLVALEAGKIDAYSTDLPTGLAVLRTNPKVKIVDFKDGGGFTVNQSDVDRDVAVKKGRKQLLDPINQFLARVSEADRAAMMQEAIDKQPLGSQ
jgi:putative lysine transport system substrate-binding protein